MWSKWPWVTSITSQASTWAAVFGLFGFTRNGSRTMAFPPGDRISKAEWPFQVKVVSRSSATVMPPAASPGAVILSPGARGYTRAVPAQQIASNLAYINWTVLTGLAVGAYAIAQLARWRTAATPDSSASR
jgi:hypothetical protein